MLLPEIMPEVKAREINAQTLLQSCLRENRAARQGGLRGIEGVERGSELRLPKAACRVWRYRLGVTCGITVAEKD